VLIGDASGHVEPADPKNSQRATINRILAELQPPGPMVSQKIVCHAFQIEGRDVSDRARRDEHFRRIAGGRDYPGGNPTFGREDTTALSNEFADLFLKAHQAEEDSVLKVHQGEDALSSEREALSREWEALSRELAERDTHGLGFSVEEVTREGGRVPAELSLDVGYVSDQDPKGNLQVEPFVLVQRSQLELFRAVLDVTVSAVKTAGDPGKAQLQKVVDNIKLGSIAINIGIYEDTPISELLRAVLGFPVRNKVFEVTPEKLAAMSAEEFERFTKEVEASSNTMKGFLDNPKIWLNLGKNDTNPQNQQAFIRVIDLP
jgi:hypothetical protein